MSATDAVSVAAAEALLRDGHVEDAERMCARLLQAEPENLGAWFLFGTLALQAGRHALAVERLQQAIRLNETAPACVFNLGLAYQGVGRLAEARQAFERTAALAPQMPEAHNSLGVVLLAQGRPAEAAASIARAIALRPDYGLAHYNRGNALKAEGRMTEAAASYREAARLMPTLVQAHANLGVVLQDIGDHAGANAAYQHALALNPNDAETLNNLGTLRRDEGKFDEAAAILTRAIAARAGFGEAHLNLGCVRYAQGRFDEAIAVLKDAQRLNARPDAVLYNLGLAYERKGEIGNALEAYKAAVRAKPDHVEPQWNAALLHLMRGEFVEGWRAYESRWGTRTLKGTARPFQQARWGGRRDLPGSLLVWGEQGIGDEILYGRMAGELADSGVPVVCEVDPRLVPLFVRSWPALRVAPRRTPPDPATQGSDIVAQVPAASLGQYLRADRAAFDRAQRAYLRAEVDRAAQYRARVKTAGRRLVGISWVSKNPEIGSRKSAALADWGPILKTPDVDFVDLQYGDTAAERTAVEAALGVHIQHLPDLDLRKDIDGLAALITACDLVITVSNTTAHLAGALGVPVWVLVPNGHGTLWYWGNSGETTPWYPSARLFRQSTAGDWTETLADVARMLTAIPPSASRRVP